MKNKTLYLNIIKSNLEVRDYKTKENICSFKWFDVINWYGIDRMKEKYWYECINDIYDYLIHGLGLVWTDNFGMDRLTQKGIDLYWANNPDGDGVKIEMQVKFL